MDKIVSYILFSQFMSLLICSVLQLTIKIRSRVNDLMALLFFLLGCLFLYFWSYRTNVISEFPFLLHSDLALTFMIGPVAYAYIKSMTGEDVSISLKSVLQYLPGLFVFCFFILYHTWGNTPAGNEGNLYPDYHSDLTVYIISILADTWFLTYIIFIIKKIYGLMKIEKFSSVKEIRVILFIIIGIATSSSLLFPAHYLKNDVLIGLVSILNGSLSVVYFLFSYRHPEYTQMVIKGPKGSRDTGIIPDNIDINDVVEKLTFIIETKNVYRDPAITLQSLSNSLEISSNHLSLILNEKFKMNFRTFINSYRIEEAKKLLSDNHGKTVLEIAYFVGFNSKSSFNFIFAKTTGSTPTAYRKNSI